LSAGKAVARAALLVAACIVLAACSSSEPRVAWEGDGAPAVSLSPAEVADAVPRPDPILDSGNTSPYVIDGVAYQVLDSGAGYDEVGIASWYGTKFHGKRTANGETYDLYIATAAHRSLPIPTYARVTNVQNQRAVIVRVNDRGPFHPDRLIDLSYAAAVKLGFVDKGTARVRVQTLEIAGVDDRRGQDSGEYRYLQLGAFANVGAANDLRASIADLVGVPVEITPVDVGGQRLSRVRVGPVADGKELRALQAKLVSRGYTPGLALP